MLLMSRCGPKGKSISMRLVRSILAFAIAMSLLMLPLGASAAGLAMSSDEMPAGMHMAGLAEMSMDECCPGDIKGSSSHTDGDKCGMGFCCTAGAIALGDVRAIAFDRLAVASSTIVIPADQVVSFRGGSPPFRPPRI
jgi:hypothetical protein